MEARRSFLKKITLGSLALTPTVTMLSGCLNSNEEYLREGIDGDDFHYFDNNLTNLHFYFINAGLDGNRLKRRKEKSLLPYMIVKIPQQHIAEEMLRETDFPKPENGYIDKDKNNTTKSQISGFSYLAFRLFPPYGDDKKEARSMKLDNIELLLDWNNEKYFELLLPEPQEYTDFNNDFNKFKTPNTNPLRVLLPANESSITFFKRVCKQLFKTRPADIPVTLLEIPRGLLLTPDKSSFGQNIKPVFAANSIGKQRFVYHTAQGKMVRCVQEIWTTQLWFQQFENGKQSGRLISPPVRAAGYTDWTDGSGTHPDCPPADEMYTYLPTYLDREEITFLTALGRKVNTAAEWQINTQGLTLTGLGAITKLHYKNFKPPVGSTLAEYEHHITLGRDEYVKVARIGVISVSGQRALYVRIGRRVIDQGVSYMQFREYVEIIQEEINYFDTQLFIKGTDGDEPPNYIQARRLPNDSNTIVHGKDEETKETDDRWNDEKVWQYLPGQVTDPAGNKTNNWHTHYRRWLFKSVRAVTLRTKPIDTRLGKVDCDADCPADNPRVFWPVLEMQEPDDTGKLINKDATLDFVGLDWNNNECRFTSTFLFIRKDVIEDIVANAPHGCIDAIYKAFANADFSRRHIDLRNQVTAYSRDYAPADAQSKELPNKSNVAQTQFLEYYFTICAEPDDVIRDDSHAPFSSIFNERAFPLYPQVKRAQLFLENLPERLPSVVEYHEDFIRYGYEVTQRVGPKDFVKNVARLLFNHTEKFMKGIEEVASVKDKITGAEEDINTSYRRIKESFSGAGAAVGGLVNPDFDVQSVALIKQSIAIGKDINKKMEQAQDISNKITHFNPSDLFRQAPEIFRGISIIDILHEVFPEFEAPVNEIKNVTAQIEQLKDEVINNPIFKEINADVEKIKNDINDVTVAIEKTKNAIDAKVRELQALKNQLNIEQQFMEVENLVKAAIDQYKIDFLEVRDGVISVVNDSVDIAAEYIATELMSKAEIIYPYWILLRSAKTDLEKLKPLLSADGQKIIDDYSKKFFEEEGYALINIAKDKENEALRAFDDVKTTVKNNITPYFTAYKDYSEKLRTEAKALETYAREKTDQHLKDYIAARKEVLDKKEKYEAQINAFIKSKTDDLLDKLVAKVDDAAAVLANEIKFREIVKTVNAVINILESSNIFYYVDLYEKGVKNFEIIRAKFKDGIYPKNVIDGIVTYLQTNKKEDIQKIRATLVTHYKDNYDRLRTDINALTRDSADKVQAYTGISVSKIVNEIAKDKLPTSVKGLKDKVDEATKILEGELKQRLRAQLKQYETLLRQQVDQQAAGIVKQIKDKIDDLERRVRLDPNNQELFNKLAQAKKIFNLLTSMSKKEVNYTWQTTSLKDADFGPVSFISSSDPRTTLSVNVHTVIYFQPSQFPAVIDRIEAVAENRLTNFGLSLLKTMTVNFNEVSFIAGTNRPAKFDVKIRDVQFSGALSFVQAFESWLKSLMGDAFRLKLGPTFVNIGYTLPIPDIRTPSFNFFNLTLNFDFYLHFDKKPLQLGFSLARPDNKFGLTVGIYAGFGFFGLIAEPKHGITEIEIGFEFGGYFGLTLGPLRGEVKLVVGLYYKKDASGVTIEGYFLCEGRVKLWFIMILARFYMGVRSQGGYVEGRCTVTYEVSLGSFFKKSFTATYYKKIAGSSPGNSGSGGSGAALAQNNAVPNGQHNFLPGGILANTKASGQPETTENPEARIVHQLSLNDWENFINSYTD